MLTRIVVPAALLAIAAGVGAKPPARPANDVGAVGGVKYVITVTDTIRSVAARFHMKPRDFQLQLKRPFRVGQVILVNPPHRSASGDDEYGYVDDYEVKPGDTLQKIADRLVVSVEELGDLNDLSIEVDVKPGDTIASLARKHSTTPDRIADWNDCSPRDAMYPGMRLVVGWDTIDVGEKIYFPMRSRAVEHIEAELRTANGVSNGAAKLQSDARSEVYTVRRGDTIESIATVRHCLAAEVRDMNAMADQEQPKPGEVLYVPPPSAHAAKKTYTPLASGQMPVRAGTVLRSAVVLSGVRGAVVARVPAGRVLDLIGTWSGGYAVLMNSGGYGWIDARAVKLGDYVGATRMNPIAQNVARKLIEIAYSYIGVPYLWGGNTYQGIDCSALVKNVYIAAGVWRWDAPRRGREQMRVGYAVPPDRLEAGDRIYFYFGHNPPGICDHTGIYIGGGKVLHASSSRGVTISGLYASRLWRFFMGARRDTAFVRVGSR